jgi:hypothetical protein
MCVLQADDIRRFNGRSRREPVPPGLSSRESLHVCAPSGRHPSLQRAFASRTHASGLSSRESLCVCPKRTTVLDASCSPVTGLPESRR